jgi:hypothetical protein
VVTENGTSDGRDSGGDGRSVPGRFRVPSAPHDLVGELRRRYRYVRSAAGIGEYRPRPLRRFDNPKRFVVDEPDVDVGDEFG